MPSLKDWFRSWRRALKASMPYVRRREHRVLQGRHADLIDALDGRATPSTSADIHIVKPLRTDLLGDVCLFVSFASQRRLKLHVARHVEHLTSAGVSVLLVVNTDLPPSQIIVDQATQDRLHGLLIRQNLGFDFAAWAHVWSLCEGKEGWTRLYLVNDSIVGPLDSGNFRRMLARIRHSSSDVIGLTESLSPQRHLQSYFLVFNAAILSSGFLARFFGRVVNWPGKAQVIEVYETRMTALVESGGWRSEAMFPALSNDPFSSDDTSLRWSELVANGFPYLKARVIAGRPSNKIKVMLHDANMDPPCD
jgi:lipopolysaccharide biosynthesis protein